MSGFTETAIDPDPTALLVSFELSQSNWVVTVRLPGSEKMSRHSVKAGDTTAVTDLLTRQQAKAERQCSQPVRIVTIYEAGLDGFWLHRWLCERGIESHVVDAASIAAQAQGEIRRDRRRDPAAHARGLVRREPRVCSMVVLRRQFVTCGDIGNVARRQAEAEQPPLAVSDAMDFCRSAAARTADLLLFRTAFSAGS
jgi:hypothetical protein